jgi:hypothetical protein
MLLLASCGLTRFRPFASAKVFLARVSPLLEQKNLGCLTNASIAEGKVGEKPKCCTSFLFDTAGPSLGHTSLALFLLAPLVV